MRAYGAAVGLLLALLLVGLPVAAHPELAALRSGAGALDVRAVNNYVAGEVRRNAIPGLAIGVVDGDRVVDVAGFGRADESGRPVTRGRRSCWLRSASR